MAAAGFSVSGRDLPIARLVALADTAEQAEAVARRGAEWMVACYFGAKHNPVGVIDPTAPGGDPVQRYLDEVILHGTPDGCSTTSCGCGTRSASTTCSPRRSAARASRC